MFDISFTELMVIGVVALIVIGPERLPKVARTLGHLVGRAQRYVNEVKTDIQREINLDEVNDLKKQINEAAHAMRHSVDATANSVREPLEQARSMLNEASQSAQKALNTSKAEDTDGVNPSSTAPAAPKPAPAADTENQT